MAQTTTGPAGRIADVDQHKWERPEGEHITEDHVRNAYKALAEGNMDMLEQYWDENMVWQVPGHNQLSGWKYGRVEFLDFMRRVGELSGGSFNMRTISIMTAGEYSTDVTHNEGTRAEDPNKKLSIDVAHVLRWRNGKVIAGRGGIFGDGTAEYDEFWS
jgi:ketosteroid isomerase-like protein